MTDVAPAVDTARPAGSEGIGPDRQAVTWTLAVIVIVGVASMFAGYEQGAFLVLGFVILVPLERLFWRHRMRVLRPELTLDLAYMLLFPVLFVFAIPAAVIAAALLAPSAGLRAAVASQPFWLQAVEALVLTDLVAYATHRVMHEVPVLWRFHSIHHSIERLDWAAAFRAHPGEGIVAGLTAVPLVLLGFDVIVVGGAFAVVTGVVGAWSHMNLRWRLAWLTPILLTPEFHHWHHARDPEAVNRNYGELFTIWDRLFGTYYVPADRRPTRYGIDADVGSTIWAHLRYPFRRPEPRPI